MTGAAEFAELCPGCFTGKGDSGICAHCGYDENLKRGPLVLPHRALLHHGQYLIGKVLGKPGGFGITYLALDTKLETKVAIKEYLPRDLAGRDAGHATISAHSVEDGKSSMPPWKKAKSHHSFARDAQQTSEDLVALISAKDHPGQDNLTVAILACESDCVPATNTAREISPPKEFT